MRLKFIEDLKEPLVLSHHPLCDRFDEHVFHLGGRKVCRGCATAYPVAIIVLLGLLIFHPLPYDALFILSVAAFVLNLGRFMVKRSIMTDILFNSLLGLSLAAIIASTLTAPSGERTAIAALAVSVFIVFNLIKGYRMFSTCRRCPMSARFPDCTVGPTERENEAIR